MNVERRVLGLAAQRLHARCDPERLEAEVRAALIAEHGRATTEASAFDLEEEPAFDLEAAVTAALALAGKLRDLLEREDLFDDEDLRDLRENVLPFVRGK